MDKVSEAVDEGRIGAAQVDAITNAAAGLTPEQQQELNTPEMIDAAAGMPADTFARAVRDEVERIKGDHGLADTIKRKSESRWKQWVDENTGMHKIFAEFDPERGEAISNAVQAQLTRLANEGGVSKDAGLAAEAAFQLLTGKATGSLGVPHISLIVDQKTVTHGAHDDSVRETVGGAPLPPESIAPVGVSRGDSEGGGGRAGLCRLMWAGNTGPQPMPNGWPRRRSTGAVRGMGVTTRLQPGDVCRRQTRGATPQAAAHEHGGATDLCNLIPLCSRHHHAVHEGQWSVKLDPDTRQLDIYDPERVHHATTWPDRATRPRPGHRSSGDRKQSESDGDDPDDAP